MTADALPRRRGILIPTLFAMTAFAVLVGLGLWQLERLAWKEGLIATLEQRLSAPPVPLPAPQTWPKLTRDESEFRRIHAAIEYLDRPRAYVYTGASALRPDVKAPGYFVFAPARIPTGEIVVVNAGYVSDRSHAWPGGKAEITGYLRWPDAPNWFVSAHDGSGSTWLVRDHHLMASRLGWGDNIAPFYIDMEAPAAPAIAPRPGPLTVKLRNDHLGYAMTWFGLAGALLVVFGLWAMRPRS